jgi:hypothetical protein
VNLASQSIGSGIQSFLRLFKEQEAISIVSLSPINDLTILLLLGR